MVIRMVSAMRALFCTFPLSLTTECLRVSLASISVPSSSLFKVTFATVRGRISGLHVRGRILLDPSTVVANVFQYACQRLFVPAGAQRRVCLAHVATEAVNSPIPDNRLHDYEL